MPKAGIGDTTTEITTSRIWGYNRYPKDQDGTHCPEDSIVSFPNGFY
jgi:hypothetical protein